MRGENVKYKFELYSWSSSGYDLSSLKLSSMQEANRYSSPKLSSGVSSSPGAHHNIYIIMLRSSAVNRTHVCVRCTRAEAIFDLWGMCGCMRWHLLYIINCAGAVRITPPSRSLIKCQTFPKVLKTESLLPHIIYSGIQFIKLLLPKVRVRCENQRLVLPKVRVRCENERLMVPKVRVWCENRNWVWFTALLRKSVAVVQCVS